MKRECLIFGAELVGFLAAILVILGALVWASAAMGTLACGL